MPIIRNKLNQRIVVNLNGGKNIDLLAKGDVDVSEDDLLSSHLRTLIAKGDIIVIQRQDVGKNETQDVKKIKIGKNRIQKR